MTDEENYPERNKSTMAEGSGYTFGMNQEALQAMQDTVNKDHVSWGTIRISTGEPAKVADESIRIGVLIEAGDLIDGDRNISYGPPSADFERTAALWSAMGFRIGGENVQAHQVAIAMALLKVSRLAWNPGKRDSWVDLAGYAACGYEAFMLGQEDL